MVKFPAPVSQVLHILRAAGIQAEVYRMYGTAYIHYVISLPHVELEEIDENSEPEHLEKSGS